MLLCVSKLSFAYDGQTTLFEGLDLGLEPGWTGIVGANGSGKTTLLRLISGELAPDAGAIDVLGTDPMPIVEHCVQGTYDAPTGLDAFLEDSSSDGVRLRTDLQIANDWGERWDTLSHGERKRLQVGLVLHRRPDVLLLDEPTNHVDRETRHYLLRVLSRFHGVGLVVSHDRELLDSLCSQCVFLDPPRVVVRPGTYSQGHEQERIESEALLARVDRTKHQLANLCNETARRQREASRADAKRSKRHLDKHDSDGRATIDRARVSGKDGQAGRLARQMDARVARVQAALGQMRVGPRYDNYLAFEGERAPRRLLFSLSAGALSLGDHRCLSHPTLTMAPDDRIAIVGRNGSGKSTLVREIVRNLTLPPERVVYLPQELDADWSRRFDAVKNLPREQRGRVLSIVSCLGSRPEPLLRSDNPSPGELRKLELARGVAQGAWLIVMDEPTNHLDLVSIECLEEALSRYRGGLLLVSHDKPFLARLATRTWELVNAPLGVTLQIR